jgi:hypothetical protein
MRTAGPRTGDRAGPADAGRRSASPGPEMNLEDAGRQRVVRPAAGSASEFGPPTLVDYPHRRVNGPRRRRASSIITRFETIAGRWPPASVICLTVKPGMGRRLQSAALLGLDAMLKEAFAEDDRQYPVAHPRWLAHRHCVVRHRAAPVYPDHHHPVRRPVLQIRWLLVLAVWSRGCQGPGRPRRQSYRQHPLVHTRAVVGARLLRRRCDPVHLHHRDPIRHPGFQVRRLSISSIRPDDRSQERGGLGGTHRLGRMRPSNCSRIVNHRRLGD